MTIATITMMSRRAPTTPPTAPPMTLRSRSASSELLEAAAATAAGALDAEAEAGVWIAPTAMGEVVLYVAASDAAKPARADERPVLAEAAACAGVTPVPCVLAATLTSHPTAGVAAWRLRRAPLPGGAVK